MLFKLKKLNKNWIKIRKKLWGQKRALSYSIEKPMLKKFDLENAVGGEHGNIFFKGLVY